MKTEIIKTEQANQEIDWSKTMLVKSKYSNVLVLTTGQHTENNFCGILITNIGGGNVHFQEGFFKEAYTPITEPITIKFIP